MSLWHILLLVGLCVNSDAQDDATSSSQEFSSAVRHHSTAGQYVCQLKRAWGLTHSAQGFSYSLLALAEYVACGDGATK